MVIDTHDGTQYHSRMSDAPTDETALPPETSEKQPTADKTPVHPSDNSAAGRNSWTRTSTGERAATFRPDDVVAARYRILKFLARGGMGEVFEAYDTELRERVALKTILPCNAEDLLAIERLKREIHLARKVSHPNVCRIFEFGRHRIEPPNATGEDIVFLTMEFLDGESLAHRLERAGPLRQSEALHIITQITAGLDAAHSAGIVHRDFKSANIMLVEESSGLRAVVTDFGIARSAATETAHVSLTASGLIIGSAAYMAPEQIEGDELTPATDIYALGVVMFEMLTGRHPFDGPTPLSVVTKRLKERPISPRVYTPALSAAWEKVILRCLERLPARRFPTAGAVAAALQGHSQRGVRIRPGRGEIAIAVVSVLIVLAGVYILVRGPEASIPSAASPKPLPPSDMPTPRQGAAQQRQGAETAAHQGESGAAPAHANPLEVPSAGDIERAAALAAEGRELLEEANLAGADAKVRDALAIWQQSGRQGDEASALSTLAAIDLLAGRMTSANMRYQEAERIARTIGDRALLASVLAGSGEAQLEAGDVAAAARQQTEALGLRQAGGPPEAVAESELALAAALSEKQGWDQAYRLARSAIQGFHDQRRADWEALALSFFARTAAAKDMEDEARTALTPVKDLLARSGDTGVRLMAQINASAAAASLGEEMAARSNLESSLVEATRLGLRPLQFEARLAMGLGEVNRGQPIVGLARLKILEKEADAEGYHLIASKAAAASVKAPSFLRNRPLLQHRPR